MKIFTSIIILFAVSLLCSCRTVAVNKNGIPPGQVKKITGSQSAAPYAPGQNKPKKKNKRKKVKYSYVVNDSYLMVSFA